MPPFSLDPAIYAATIGAIKANELPKYTGDFPLVQRIQINVPIPAVTKATAIDKASPSTPAAAIPLLTSIGTYLALLLAPGNMARMSKHNDEFAQLSLFEKLKTNIPKVFDLLFKVKGSIYINILIALNSLDSSFSLSKTSSSK